jgi:hypothetical protein
MGRRLRRETGAHYTSEENILKVIRPLFLDGLWEEFGSLKADPEALARFREKISRLKFLDPACGSGDFLIITYRELRTLELEALKLPHPGSPPHFAPPPGPMVNAGQFSGIELDDFPCRIARLGMWLMDRQMDLRALAALPGLPHAPRPAPPGPNIAHGNALRMDWETVAPKKELSYVFGNPPYLGYSNQSPDQKADVLSVYRAPDGSPYPSAGKIDYVAAWYYKAAKFMEGTGIQAAFVSTSSIVQGEQVAFVWRPLLEDHGLKIDFARRPFKWASPAKGKAAVRCVIVGFGRAGDGDNPRESPREKIIYDGDKKMPAQNINPYLVDGPNVFFASRSKAICPVPGMVYGNKPADGGFFFLDAKGREELLTREPGAQKYIKQVYGAREYINGIKRYCLWLIDADPSDLLKLPSVMERVEKVRLFRLASQKKQTRQSASTPTLFQEIRQPASEYIIVPRHSSESRKYIPIGFVSPEILTNDAVFIIPGATLYHFAILTSIVHMAWVRATCGRIEVDYRYSKDVVYNNFPWPDPTASRREEISALARTILEARALFPGSTLAALYDPQKTPPPLLEAHEKLDRAVMALYGLKPRKGQNEGAIVSGLTGLYQKLTGGH